MPQETEDVTIKTPSGETIHATIPKGLDDAGVYKLMSTKAPDLMAPAAPKAPQAQMPGANILPPELRQSLAQQNDPNAVAGGMQNAFGGLVAPGVGKNPIASSAANLIKDRTMAKLAQAAAEHPVIAGGVKKAATGAALGVGYEAERYLKRKASELLGLKGAGR